MKMYSVTYLVAIITLGLMAGLFYNWSFNITSGLAKMDDRSYLNSMQILNRTILNPAFFFIFLGSIFTLPFLCYLQSKIAFDISFYFVAAAAIIYILGSIGTTFFGNIPLNNNLEALNLSQLNNEECKSFRTLFESKWNNLNLIRTISSFVSFILLLIPLVFKFD